MFVEERQDKILEMLRKFGKVRVKDLSKQFSVTEDCIRKDMAALERQGLLKRTYGGAVRVKLTDATSSYDVLKPHVLDDGSKQAMAAKAVKLINDGEMVFLDISSVNVEIAKLLCQSDKNLTVVTNMIDILKILAAVKQMRVIFIGGALNSNGTGFCDSMARDFISRLKPDIAFVGIVGINPQENSVSTYDIEDGINKAMIVKVSKKAYVLAEQTKFQPSGNYNYASLDSIDGIIVDAPLNERLQELLESAGLDVV